MSESASDLTRTGDDVCPPAAITSPVSRTILRIAYGWVKMPDAIVRYAFASSSRFTSEAPKAVVGYARKGVCIPRVRAVPRTLETPICRVIQMATALRDSEIGRAH